MSTKKRYYQHYKDDYAKEFSFISKSRLGSSYAFCTCCRADISICHGGKGDIVLHAKTKKHADAYKVVNSNQTINKSFFSVENRSTTNGECLFTAFLVEHNLPLNCSDHIGMLFKKMFPDSAIAKTYGSGRTKTSAIISEMSCNEREFLKETMKTRPFAIATDGSNDIDSKLYPIVITIFNSKQQKIVNSLLSVPSLEGDGTGLNIGNLLIKTLEINKIPLSNLIALGCDNAPVMVGSKSGVAATLKQKNENIEIMGCTCHLLALAAEKGAACLPFKVDEILVDIYYYLQKSSKRKDRLKILQQFHDTGVKKVLKHVSTRWLSVGKCLNRLLDQWQPITTFFKEETMKSNKIGSLDFFKIPLKNPINEDAKNSKPKIDSIQKKRKLEQSSVVTKKQKLGGSSSVLSREERVFYFLTTQVNKVFCLFLSYIVPALENVNIKLQSAEPLIHVLRPILIDLFKDVLLKFVKPNLIKSTPDILKVKYNPRENQKEDTDLLIGTMTSKLVEELMEDEKILFYEKVRLYFTTVCDYTRNKFPFASEVLHHAEVALVNNFEKASFSSVAYFAKRFSIFFDKTEEEALDVLQPRVQ